MTATKKNKIPMSYSLLNHTQQSYYLHLLGCLSLRVASMAPMSLFEFPGQFVCQLLPHVNHNNNKNKKEEENI